MAHKARTKTANRNKGSSWASTKKRIRIHHRDGWRCALCGCKVYSLRLCNAEGIDPMELEAEGMRVATLDHVKTRHKHGHDNRPENLVTVCVHCNSSRQDRTIRSFARLLERRDRRRSVTAVLRRVRNAVRRKLPDIDEVCFEY